MMLEREAKALLLCNPNRNNLIVEDTIPSLGTRTKALFQTERAEQYAPVRVVFHFFLAHGVLIGEPKQKL